jgi:hypothetical protein
MTIAAKAIASHTRAERRSKSEKAYWSAGTPPICAPSGTPVALTLTRSPTPISTGPRDVERGGVTLVRARGQAHRRPAAFRAPGRAAGSAVATERQPSASTTVTRADSVSRAPTAPDDSIGSPEGHRPRARRP